MRTKLILAAATVAVGAYARWATTPVAKAFQLGFDLGERQGGKHKEHITDALIRAHIRAHYAPPGEPDQQREPEPADA